MAAKLDISIEQGTTWKMKITLKSSSGNIPITNYTFEGAIKQTIYDTTEYPISFEVEDEANGVLWAIVEPDVSSQMDFTEGVYNIKYVASPTEKYRMFEGDVVISLEV